MGFFNFLKKFAKVTLIATLIAVILLAVIYIIIYLRTPKPKDGELEIPLPMEATSSKFDIQIFLPENNEVVNSLKTTIVGKTVYKKQVILVTSKGDFYSVQPKEDGTFSQEIDVDWGSNEVSAYVFPDNLSSRTKKTTFYYLPDESLGDNDIVTAGKVRHIATKDFLFSSERFGMSTVTVDEDTQVFNYIDDSNKTPITMFNLKLEGDTTIISEKTGQKDFVAKKVYVKPLFSSFVGEVKGVASTIILKPRYGWETEVITHLLPDFTVKRYNKEDNTFSQVTQDDVIEGSKVLVDFLQIPYKNSEIELKTILLLDM